MKMYALALLAALSCPASTVNCASGVVDVTTMTAGNGCTINGEVYSNFTVTTSSQFTSYVVSLLGADYINGYEDLHFGVTANPSFIVRTDDSDAGSIWARIEFDVTAPGPWINSMDLKNIDGHGVVIYEQGCASAYADNWGECPSADLVASFHASGGEEVAAYFPGMTTLHVRKDLSYSDASLFLFDEGFEVAPEPSTIGMIFGGGLLLIAGKWRKRRC